MRTEGVMTAATEAAEAASHPGTAVEVLRVFTKLGFTSFGGPIAHLGFFRTEFIERRRWVDEAHDADVVALSQFCRDSRAARWASSSACCGRGFREP